MSKASAQASSKMYNPHLAQNNGKHYRQTSKIKNQTEFACHFLRQDAWSKAKTGIQLKQPDTYRHGCYV